MPAIRKKSKKTGFTLVELSFAVLFVALLALTVVVITMDLISNYKRGLMLKQVNTVGNSIIDDFRASISSSSSKKITNLCEINFNGNTGTARNDCEADQAYSAVYLYRNGNVTINGDTQHPKNVVLYGAFCSGSYSYIWNSGYLFGGNYAASTGKASLRYLDTNSNVATLSDFRLIKISDPKRHVCLSKSSNLGTSAATITQTYTKNTSLANSLTGDFDIARFGEAVAEAPVDLLENDDYSDLALYDLSITKPASDTSARNIFYSGSFILATIRGGIDINATGDYCTTPDDFVNEDFEYCAINKFNFAIQASGE
ncbi:hypothetical protein J6S46_02005 [Candidatus Saccharibacteria bacterium]|nr:hypothetical protein [Candidatus Saccharibacteria bacterium]